MKLSKVYSNKPFKNIEFNNGLNVILGKISDRQNHEVDSHNIGKTLLLEVIDFLLLKEISNKDKYFLTKQDIFSDYVFYAELQLNSGGYLLIRRTVMNNTKISFKTLDQKLPNFDLTIGNWDYENLPIKVAKQRLDEYLNFDIAIDYDYRKTINYFMRHQNDYIDVFKLGKFQGPHRDWKPMVFELLKFDGKLLYQKLELDDKLEKLIEKLSIIEKENKVSSEDEDKITGLIDINQTKFLDISTKIDKFNFYDQDNLVREELVNVIEEKIKLANTERYAISYEINKIEKALSNSIDYIDVQDLMTLYEDVKIFFPEGLIQEYDKVVDFNYQITQERSKYLNESLGVFKIQLQYVQDELRVLEEKKSKIFMTLTEKSTYEKFKIYQKELSKAEADILVLKEKLLSINRMSRLQEEIANLKQIINGVIDRLKHQISQQKHRHIRRLFNDFTEKILNTTAILSVKQNKSHNIDFLAEYANKEELVSSDLASGHTYKKILCAAFDISLLQNYRQDSFYRFVYHDGVLDTLDIRKKEKYIEYMRLVVQQYNVQYILTVIESELTGLQEEFMFTPDEICLTLSDRSCKDKLFECCF